jgi:hypothetical protein
MDLDDLTARTSVGPLMTQGVREPCRGLTVEIGGWEALQEKRSLGQGKHPQRYSQPQCRVPGGYVDFAACS